MNLVAKLKNSKNLIDIQKDININSQNQSYLIEITTTNQCNCNCKYCFETDHSKKYFSSEEQERQLNLIIDFCDKDYIRHYKKVSIVFWGGEPMLNLDYIKNIIYATKKYKFVTYFMYSNGTLYEKYKEFINLDVIQEVKSRFSIQLSYDGEPHNTIMRCNDGDKTIKTAKLLSENNFKIAFKATLSYDLLKYLPDIWKSYEKLYYDFNCNSNIDYAPTLDTTCKDCPDDYIEIWKKSILEIAKLEFKFIKKNKKFLMSWFKDRQQYRTNCSLSGKILFDIDGNIYLCHGCPYSKHKSDFLLGNTKSIQSLDDVFKINLDFKKQNYRSIECLKCGATFCNICNIAQVNSKRYKDDWIECSTNNKLRCTFFRYFGIVNRALLLALFESKYLYVNKRTIEYFS